MQYMLANITQCQIDQVNQYLQLTVRRRWHMRHYARELRPINFSHLGRQRIAFIDVLKITVHR